MPVEALLTLPRWLYLGVLLGALLSVGVAVTFVVAARVFPDGGGDTGRSFSTEDRRRVEIRRYLDAIGEGFTEDVAVHGERVAFYLPHRGVAVTFDARTFYALDGTPTHAVLVEHELPGIALGSRLPFETPDISFGEDENESETASQADRLTERERAAYAVLGLPADADRNAVQRAYRKRIKEVHPDHGGDKAAFERVRDAYDTAKRHAS
ncbi:J domain-containing protein [Natronomonas halophila]|uniref:J domain-containing protein n=1 Tax=Natronomonas halophila TaxID=2747817 RepID=UPI0015B5FD68|nr:J domain-containing protein [Natronomonas halophila]QLD86642.1 J domain-containing protein [Natronomonas halophila]